VASLGVLRRAISREYEPMVKELDHPPYENTVTLVGRLGVTVSERELPSGDTVTSFSVVVERPPRDRRGKTTVDSIPCQTFSVSIGTRVLNWQPGEWIQVTGALRRRFWRSAQSPQSLLEVQATSVRKVRK
jgi:single-strand DNA-binding protein